MKLSPKTALRVSAACVTQALRGELFILSVESGELLVLDGPAGALWEQLVAGRSIAQAVSQLPGAALDEALELAEELVQHGVLVPAAGGGGGARAPRERQLAPEVERARVAILYPYRAWPSAFSVAHVVLSQCLTLARHGFSVRLITQAGCPRPALPSAIEFEPALPDDREWGDAEGSIQELARSLARRLDASLDGCELVITHDIVLLEELLAYNLAIRELAPRSSRRWLHWLHSTPRARPKAPPPFPQRQLFRAMTRARYVCVSPTHRAATAAMLSIDIADVGVVANTRLSANFFGGPLLWSIAARHALSSASVVSIFPTRLNRVAKQAEFALFIVRSLKALGHTVRLVFVSPDSDTDAERTRILQLRWLAERIGLTESELIFLGDEDDALRADCPNALVRDLLLLSNVFIHPSAAEAHSLTLLEAACMKNLCVLNADVPSFRDVAGEHAVWLNCGALGAAGVDERTIERALARHRRGESAQAGDSLIERLIVRYGKSPDQRGFYPLHARYYLEHKDTFDACALEISSRLERSPALALHRRVRGRYSADQIMQRELLPLLQAALQEVRVESGSRDLTASATARPPA